jgi:hypothetical protein
MEQTDLAIAAQRRGNREEALSLYRSAFTSEHQAAQALSDKLDAEPTRSILHRSAATLALDCGQYREAEVLICEALRGMPPEGIAEELRDLLEQVYFRRHLELRGITLSETEIQMSIAGKSVGFGIAPVEVFVPRITDAQRLLYRTVERLRNLPFKRRISTAVLSTLELFTTVPRAASFAVTFRVGHNTDTTLDGVGSPADGAIDDLLTCLDLFNTGNAAELKRRIPQVGYYNSFVMLARNISPDGEDVSLVGFTAVRQGVTKTVSLTKGTIGTPLFAAELTAAVAQAPSRADRNAQLRGFLKEVDARDGKRGKIQVVDAGGTSHTVIVPPGMMTDIVKRLWESEVEISGRRKGNAIHLATIRPAKPARKI